MSKTHITRGAGDSHYTVCGLDMRTHSVQSYGSHYSMQDITCKACNGQQNRHPYN